MSEDKQKPLLENQGKVTQNIIKQQKSTSLIIFQAIIASCGGFFTGYAAGELNMAHDILDLKYGIPPEQSNLGYGYITSSMPLGAAVGSILAGILLNKISRRGVFFTADILGIIACSMFLYKNFYLAVVLRFIMGIIVGLNSTVVPLYLREISPISISGTVGIMNQGTTNLGTLIGYALGLGFPLDHQRLEESGEFYWRFVLFFPVIPCLIRTLGMAFIFRNDTAQYYLLEGQEDKARSVIEKTYKQEYQNEVFDNLQVEAFKKKQRVDTWGLVFSSKYRSRLVLGCMVQIIKQFSGISAVLYYSATQFQACLGDRRLANYMAVLSGLNLMISSFCSGFLTKKFGRRPILLYGQLASVIALISVGTSSYFTRDQVAAGNVSTLNSLISISLIFIYSSVLYLTIGPLCWVYNADILNSEKGLGFATGCNWFCAFIVGITFPPLQDEVGIYTTFYMFAVFALLGLIYFKFTLKETKGLTQQQIIGMFTNEKDENDKYSCVSLEEMERRESILESTC